MAAAVHQTTADDAILIEPLSAAVGLEVRGATLDPPSDAVAAMVRDLWQVGGALLFRGCTDPAHSAATLAHAIAGKTLIAVQASLPGGSEWGMVGAESSDPLPLACIVGTADGALPPLWLAGMEAAADALRLTGAETLAETEGRHVAHSLDAPMRPVLYPHPQSGATVLYPPPRRSVGKDPLLLALLRAAEDPGFTYRHEWQPGDVLAWDPCAIRSRWEQSPAEGGASGVATSFSVVRAASALPPTPEWELPV